jgi:hypothetical protein
MTPKIFTVEEVDALIPELSRRVGAQIALGAEIERIVKQLSRETGEPVASLESRPGEPRSARALRAQLSDCVGRYEEGWRDIQGLGAVVKDTSMGLIDFCGRVDGRLVWLCWRYGEDNLGYYHELDTGFSGRRALGPETRSRMLN